MYGIGDSSSQTEPPPVWGRHKISSKILKHPPKNEGDERTIKNPWKVVAIDFLPRAIFSAQVSPFVLYDFYLQKEVCTEFHLQKEVCTEFYLFGSGGKREWRIEAVQVEKEMEERMAAAAAAEEGGEDSSSIPQKVTKVSLKILFSHKLRMRWQNDNDGLL